MKNKKLTYLLGLVVLIVWGIIIYRIFDAISGTDDQSAATGIKSKKETEAYNDFEIPKDTTHLLLNYRDPFGLIKQKDTSGLSVRRITHKTTMQPVKPATNWGFIKYSGYILNPVSKKLIALVSINDHQVTLSEGETKERVKLVRNLKDSIKISFEGKVKFIVMKSAAL